MEPLNTHRLVEPMVIGSGNDATTRVHLVVRAQRIRILLRKEGKRDTEEEQRCFEYTGRFYYLHNTTANTLGISAVAPLLPGPTLAVPAGGVLHVTVTNELGPDDLSVPFTRNSFHHSNATNIHFHGLHADPNVDNPFPKIQGGGQGGLASIAYPITVPSDHLAGLHWYHAHAHGAVYQQIMGGLFGAVRVVRGSRKTSSGQALVDEESWEECASLTDVDIAALPHTLLVIHLYRLALSSKCDGATMQMVDEMSHSRIPSNPRIVTRGGSHAEKEHSLPPELFLVNGQHQPDVHVGIGSPHVLDMLFAAGSCFLNLTMSSHKNAVKKNPCDFHLIAIDGVPLSVSEPHTFLYFATATRLSVIVVCNTKGTFPVKTHWRDSGEGITVFNLHADGDADAKNTKSVSFPLINKRLSKSERGSGLPNYLDVNEKMKNVRASSDESNRGQAQAVRLGEATETVHFQRDISFSQLGRREGQTTYVMGQGVDCSSLNRTSNESAESQCHYSDFEGQRGTFDAFIKKKGLAASAITDRAVLNDMLTTHIHTNYKGFAVPRGAIVTARVFGDPLDANPHPIHFHVNHFEFISFVPRKGGRHEWVGAIGDDDGTPVLASNANPYGLRPHQIRDTMPILDGVTTIKWRAASYVGEVVYHCHALPHEDRGMMATYLVYDEQYSQTATDHLFSDDKVSVNTYPWNFFSSPLTVQVSSWPLLFGFGALALIGVVCFRALFYKCSEFLACRRRRSQYHDIDGGVAEMG